MHIGVYGALQSSFSALVTTSDAGTDAAVTLLDAQPLDVTIAASAHYAYFEFTVPEATKRVTFVIDVGRCPPPISNPSPTHLQPTSNLPPTVARTCLRS